eukprot:SAG11_NODE_580_length_8367_cov_3.375060_9_plen_162_part_00
MTSNSRSITGLDPVQDIVCEVLDVVQKVTIDGETPVAKQFLAYNPTDDTTTYQDVDPAQDLDINSLPTLATAANTDALIIYDSNSGTNKKIAPNQISPTITAQAPLTIYNNDIGLSYDTNDFDNTGSGLALKNKTISGVPLGSNLANLSISANGTSITYNG